LRKLAFSASRFKSTATPVKKCERGIAAVLLLLPVAGTTAQAIAVLPLPLLLVVCLLV
jgi:hypothetical protein